MLVSDITTARFDVSVIYFTSGNNLLTSLGAVGCSPTQSQLFDVTAVLVSYLTLILLLLSNVKNWTAFSVKLDTMCFFHTSQFSAVGQ